MSQVNYVQQVNLFMEYARRNRLTSHERIFFFALFHVANTWAQRAENHEWPDVYFQVSNSEIHEWSDLEERAIRNTRNSLKQRGLIDFRKGDGKKRDPEYRINYLAVIGYKIAPVCVGDHEANGCNFAPGDAGGYVGDHVGDAVPEPVGEQRTNGCNFAPDAVGGAYSSPYTPCIYNINANQGTVNARTITKATARRYDQRAQEAGSFGLVDMNSGGSEVIDGLIPLPWDKEAVRR